MDVGRRMAPNVDNANVAGGGEGEGDNNNDDMETSLLPPDKCRPLENATLMTLRSYGTCRGANSGAISFRDGQGGIG